MVRTTSERKSWSAWLDDGRAAGNVTQAAAQDIPPTLTKGDLSMKRSVRKFGLAAAIVLGTLAFGATPARAQAYWSRYYAPTPVTTYYYTPSQSPDGTTSY